MQVNNPGIHTIMVVRKKQSSSHDISALADQNDIRILTAENGTQAIALFEQHPEISLILINSDLEFNNGYDTTLNLRELNEKVPIILMVNYNSYETFKLASLVGCSQLLQSPVEPEELKTIVFKYLK